MSFLPKSRQIGNQPGPVHYGFIDNAKAIGIVLVVLGHSRGLPDYPLRLIFGFHVPLFFFLSGFLVKSGRLEATVGSNAKRVLRILGLPYVLFFSLALLYWFATRDIGVKALLYGADAWYEPVAGLFTGLEADLFVDPPLWFLPCLILAAIAYQASRKFLSAGAAAGLYTVSAFFLTIYWKFSPFRLPLGLDSMWIALSFYAIGQQVRERNLYGGREAAHRIPVFLIASALLVFGIMLNGRADLANMDFGVLPALYMPIALFGIIATLSISQIVPPSRAANWLSQNTLIIFPVHFIFLSLVRGAAISLHMLPDDYVYALGWSLISSALAILFCIPLVYCLRRGPGRPIRQAR
jgi:acyltransferase